MATAPAFGQATFGAQSESLCIEYFSFKLAKRDNDFFLGFGAQAPTAAAPSFGFNTATTSASTGLGGSTFGGFGAAPTTSGTYHLQLCYCMHELS